VSINWLSVVDCKRVIWRRVFCYLALLPGSKKLAIASSYSLHISMKSNWSYFGTSRETSPGAGNFTTTGRFLAVGSLLVNGCDSGSLVELSAVGQLSSSTWASSAGVLRTWRLPPCSAILQIWSTNSGIGNIHIGETLYVIDNTVYRRYFF
jgi:hypothetical protein